MERVKITKEMVKEATKKYLEKVAQLKNNTYLCISE